MNKTNVLTCYEGFLQKSEFLPKTIDAYLSYTGRFIRHTKKPVTRLTAADAQAFIETLPKSAQRVAKSALHHLYTTCLRRSIALHAAPAISAVNIPSREAVKSLLFSLSERVFLFASLIYSGARPSEVLALQVSDINCPERTVAIRGRDSGASRTIPIGEELIAPLSAHLASLYRRFQGEQLSQRDNKSKAQARRRGGAFDRAIVFGSDLHPFNEADVSSYQKALGRNCDSLGLWPRIDSRRLRAAFAVHALENGFLPGEVMEWMGRQNEDEFVALFGAARKRARKKIHPLSDVLQALAR